MFQAFFSAVYPLNCLGCSRALVQCENKYCLSCFAGFEDIQSLKKEIGKTSFDQVFWGRSLVDQSAVLFNYIKGENLAQFIHEFKYNGNRKIGKEFSRLMWQNLYANPFFEDVDCLAYVPMHKKKEKKRGYNQAKVLAEYIGELSGIPCSDLIKRTVQTKTQTDKDVYERFENMKNRFEVIDLIQIPKHILIIDDVVTTGATLSACVNMLKEKYEVKVSVMALAYRDL